MILDCGVNHGIHHRIDRVPVVDASACHPVAHVSRKSRHRDFTWRHLAGHAGSFFSSGLTIGPLMMGLGGEGYFPSRSIEFAVIVVFTIVAIWIIARFVGRAPRSTLA